MTTPREPRSRRVTKRGNGRAIASCLIAILFASWAGTAIAESGLSTTIAPQPLAAALAEFARQTGLQILFVSKIAAGLTSKEIPAGLSGNEALAQLLDGTGLRYEFLNARTVRIYAQAAETVVSQQQAPRPEAHRLGPLEEVIIVGLRDEEAGTVDDYMRNVPASVTVLSGDTLESHHAEQLSEYADGVPGLYVASLGSPGEANVNLRGISTFSGASAVGFYIDDTPLGPSGPYLLASSFPLDLMPYDLERLEVLRGPQGTQYGAASEVGVIRYVLKEPSVSEVQAGFGATGTTVAGAAGPGDSFQSFVNAPLVHGILGLRMSAYRSSTPGYIDNSLSGAKDVNGERTSGGRIALLWTPANSLTVKLNAFWTRAVADSATTVSYLGLRVVPNTGDALVVAPASTTRNLTESAAFEAPFAYTLAYYSLAAHWSPGPVELSSATAWSNTTTRYSSDQTQYVSLSGLSPDLARSDTDQGIRKFTQELRIASQQGGRIGWLAGAFYAHDADRYQAAYYTFDTSYRPLGFSAQTALPSTYEELALFGDVTWRISNRVDLTGGVRYTRDRQFLNFVYYDTYVSPPELAGHSSEALTSWMADARYRLASEEMLYARIATGYQPGFPNAAQLQNNPQTPLIVPKESLTNYELGIKTELGNQRARIDLAAFHIDYRNIQICATATSLCTSSSNRARSRGLELTARYAPLPGLSLQYTAAYTQAILTELAPHGCCALTGYQLPEVPKWGMAFSADYDWSLAGAWRAHVGLTSHWIDQRWGSQPESVSSGLAYPAVVLPSFSVLDFLAELAKGRYRLRAFAKNVANTRGYLSGGVIGNDLSNLYQINYVLLQPRTFGLRLDCTF